MPRPIITLTTDFGLRDPYVAEMKAVILNISPEAVIVDVSHQIEKFNVKMGAYILASSAPYFPKGTIHVAVVDPGVGSKRHPILIQSKREFFIGPDNGLLALASTKLGIEHIYQISNKRFMLPEISSTFHGRDMFAPAAAYLASGIAPKEFGLEIRKIAMPRFAKIVKRRNLLIGEVLHVDDFGNVITNLGEPEVKQLGAKANIDFKLKNRRLKLKLCKTYSDVKPQEPLAIIGSHNLLEISINQGNAAEAFSIKEGDKIAIYHAG
jgi:hypothetical protein